MATSLGNSISLPFGAILILLSGAVGTSGQTIAITDVTVINPREQTVSANRTVVVERGRILSIQSSSVKPPEGARVINGKQKYLIPGLWDAHVHLTKAGMSSLPLFIANGVTGVRDMGSDFSEAAKWRSQIDAGELVGPRIKTSGQMIESRANIERLRREGTVEPVDRLRIGVANPAEARVAVKRLAGEGVDHIKMRTTPDVNTFEAVAAEAGRHGLPFAAHPVAPPEELLRTGLRSVEHFLAFPPVDGADEHRLALFRKMAQAGVFMSDTGINLDVLAVLPYNEVKARVEDSAGKLDSRRQYVCGYLIDDWREQAEELKDPSTAKAYRSLRDQLQKHYRNIREMRRQGVQFLVGTDVGVVLMYPGFSLHDELQKMVRDLGFEPMEVLRIATTNMAAFYGGKQQFGAIEKGQEADLLLLDADPVADIHNTTSIHGVMAQGRWFDRAALDHLLEQVKEVARSGCRGLPPR
jgi:imidazolonepropionase-like amidohydrolase